MSARLLMPIVENLFYCKRPYSNTARHMNHTRKSCLSSWRSTNHFENTFFYPALYIEPHHTTFFSIISQFWWRFLCTLFCLFFPIPFRFQLVSFLFFAHFMNMCVVYYTKRNWSSFSCIFACHEEVAGVYTQVVSRLFSILHEKHKRTEVKCIFVNTE